MGGEWMMGKFASVTATASLTLLVVTILFGVRGVAQSAPAGQAPATPSTAPAPAAQQPSTPNTTAQQPASGGELADEESTLRRKKPKDYKNWNFNVGAGANLDSGATQTWVRGGGFSGSVGVARNANKYLGLRADFIYADLPLRDSTQNLAQATGATSYAYGVTLSPIINIPVTSQWSGYVLIGPGYYHRAGSLNDDSTLPGSACNAFWSWWGACQNSNAFVPISGSFTNTSLNQFGYNLGGGVARKMPSGVEIYVEYRLIHGSHSGITTDFRPITLGFRW
jgi:opacity protein-like surface antigen